MPIDRPKYAELYFGKSDSLNELHEEPSEFMKSFVNLDHIVDKVTEATATMVLGPKGTGKSALAWYLHESGPSKGHLAEVRDASSLPLADIPLLETGQTEGKERTVTAWRFILLCNYLDLVLKDQSAQIPHASEVKRVVRLLRDFGFMGGSTAGRAMLSITKTTISIPIPKLGNIYQRESKPTLSIFSLLPYLEEWAANVRSGNRHILLLDGLDSIFLNDLKYDESMAALVQAAYLINQLFASNGATGSVVLLLRNDVFSRVSLTLPDSQKMRDDLAVELDWRILSGSLGRRAPLLTLVNRKASKALDGRALEVLDYFPSTIEVGRHSRGGPPRSMKTLPYLLNLTRHTPRDLLRLFDEIRKVEASGAFPPSRSGERLRQDVIREGVLQYSNRYFTNAIRNEFAGFSENGEIEASIAALQSVQNQQFYRDQFAEALAENGYTSASTADRCLRLLFFAGAIGNRVRRAQGQESYLQFYHRRDDAQVYLRGPMILHNALCHAWNVPFSN